MEIPLNIPIATPPPCSLPPRNPGCGVTATAGRRWGRNDFNWFFRGQSPREACLGLQGEQDIGVARLNRQLLPGRPKYTISCVGTRLLFEGPVLCAILPWQGFSALHWASSISAIPNENPHFFQAFEKLHQGALKVKSTRILS